MHAPPLPEVPAAQRPAHRLRGADVKQRVIAIVADVAAILLFVVLGRGSHDEGNGIASVLNVAAPFLIGLAVGWLLSPTARVRWWPWPATSPTRPTARSSPRPQRRSDRYDCS